jgi:ABC-type glycerol-3-phosphate transport system substrate-binding protein
MKKLLGILVALAMLLATGSFALAEDTTITYWFWADNDAYPPPCRK